MATILIAVPLFGLSILGLAAGLLMGRGPIRGSCGGPAARCGVCNKRCGKRP